MIQLTIIRIEGYGQWTLTLGSDREAQLQMLQARIYHDVQRLFSERDSIVFFNRFDEYFAITNALDINARIFGSLQHQADIAQIMHIDIDSSTKVGNWLSPYELTALIMKIYSTLAQEFLKHDSLAFFLGGDNVMVISNGMTKEQADEVLKKVTAGNDIKLNCGIGIGKTGRRAAEAATKALDTIRDLREEGKIQTIYEIQCP